jgi:hypothetical protein
MISDSTIDPSLDSGSGCITAITGFVAAITNGSFVVTTFAAVTGSEAPFFTPTGWGGKRSVVTESNPWTVAV